MDSNKTDSRQHTKYMHFTLFVQCKEEEELKICNVVRFGETRPAGCMSRAKLVPDITNPTMT